MSPRFNQGHPCIQNLYLFRPVLLDNEKPEPQTLANRYSNAKGETKISGNANLKGSQSYPPRLLDQRQTSQTSLCVACWLVLSCCLGCMAGRPLLTVRFGAAVAKLRSSYKKDIQAEAAEWLKDAIQKPRAVRSDAATDARWIADADLKPVLRFLRRGV